MKKLRNINYSYLAFGKNLKAWIIEFQKQNDLEPDGNIGPITLNKLREYGLSL